MQLLPSTDVNSTSFPWLTCIIGVLFVFYLIYLVATVLVSWNEIRALALRVHNSFVFTMPSREHALVGLDEIESSDAEKESEALRRLLKYAEAFKPDWIIGVNTGGRLISAALARLVNVAQDRCVYLRYDNVLSQIVMVPESFELRGTVLVIDDISRSGRTLEEVKAFLMRSNDTNMFRITTAKFAILVLDDVKKHVHTSFAPDFASFKTKKDTFQFSWWKVGEEVKAEQQIARKRHISAHAQLSSESWKDSTEGRIAVDVDFADTVLKKYVG